MRHAAFALVIAPLCLAGCVSISGRPGDTTPSTATNVELILARPDLLTESRALVRDSNVYILPAYHALMADADSALRVKAFSVMQKQTMPPSGDKHDYLSMAPYWWPDPSKPNGLPYIRRDGEMNPQTRIDHDGLRFGAMVNAVESLALAYWFTGETKYAAKAAMLVRVWFLDPATRMNPNLRFAQAILGVTEGRGIGILDLRAFPRLVDALALLEPSGAFSKSDETAFRSWCSTYLDWLINSDNGKDERSQPNNHGTLYDAQAASIALYLGRDSLAKTLIWNDGRMHVDSQITASGSQPLELDRTRPIHYSLFNLDAYTQLAELGRHVNADLWHYSNPAGASIPRALQFIAPYATGEKTWSKPDIAGIEPEEKSVALRRAGSALGDTTFMKAAVKASGTRNNASREILFYPHIALPSTDSLLSHALEFAKSRLRESASTLDPANGFPRSTGEHGQWQQRPFNQWTSGFFSGTLWYMYQIDHSPEWKSLATKWTAGIEPAKSIKTTHDLGFMVFDSFGHGFLLTGDSAYKAIVLEAARNLAARYNPRVGAIQSWDTYGGVDARKDWKYPVIIDNLMNLELLFRASEWGHPEWRAIAERHALTTARTHVRVDGSTSHVALFDPSTGHLERTVTWQGFADSSAWARGQAWAIYGFTSAYGFTGNKTLLDAAERTADWFLAHGPLDGVPWWDLRHPQIPNVERDASAAAIAASGLLDLSRRVDHDRAVRYHDAAERILRTLASQYLTEAGNMASILAHSAGGRPQNSEVDTGIVYADYYFVEALLRERGLYLQ